MSNTLAEDCGRLFEVGFNIGILTYIRQNEKLFSHHLDTLYIDDLRKLHFSEMMKEAFKRTTFSFSPHKRNVAKQWFMFFLQKGFLAGLNFFREYLESLDWKNHAEKITIAYYQCSFCRENSIYTHTKPAEKEWRDILSQLSAYGLASDKINIHQHNKKGQFLHADCLLLLQYGEQWRIFCVDLSVFSVTSPTNMKDTNDIAVMQKLLLNELGYIRSKSVFTNLSIDTSAGAPGFAFSQGLQTYFTAFKRDDKESTKLIQAGSYTYDFYHFLLKQGVLKPETPVIANIIGYTDRGINAMSVNQENIEVLHPCFTIYRHDPGPQEIQEARQNVLEMISSNAAESFKDGIPFTASITGLANHDEDGIYWIPTYRECEEQFLCPWDKLQSDLVPQDIIRRIGSKASDDINLLDAHAELVQQELEMRLPGEDIRPYVFLTGNPGIGKTTAIVEFLKAHMDEGFLFFYISPRKQVNLDIINKFRVGESGPLHGNILALTSDAITIHNNWDKPTVQYYSAQHEGTFWRPGVDAKVCFQDAEEQERGDQQNHMHRLEQFQEDLIRAQDSKASGVLSSICNALYTNMQDPLSNQVIATVAIQSLKKTTGQGTTLRHLEKIFSGAFNAKKRTIIEGKMKEISGRFRHIFIMIDEITGDEGGVEFLTGIRSFINRYGLTNPKYGFNTRVIVADASIVDRKVIEQHLITTDYSPDKIYFRQLPREEIPPPLSREEFEFRDQKAVMINANAYPARRLHITYNVGIEFVKYEEENSLDTKDHLPESVQKHIFQDIIMLLQREKVEQLIIYIQDKQRLARLIAALRKHYGTFEKDVHYLEIHANISEEEKKTTTKRKNNVQFIFMTASASRGLSFPKATHIFVDIPRFEIEQNLMEIIQVIYRGRGDKERDQQEKELHFYLSDRAVYLDDENRQLARRECTLNLLNILLILKTSIMTRISGYGQIGVKQFVMIPIGGRSVVLAGETFPSKMEKLINSLRSEYHRRPDHKELEHVYMSLKELFSEANFGLSETTKNKPSEERSELSYLSLLSMSSSFTLFSSRFEDAAYNGFHRLLEWDPLELGFIAGGLLIVSLADKIMQERYLMQLASKLKITKESDLWQEMKSIRANREYAPSLHTAIQDAIELIEKIASASPEKTQQLVEDSQQGDQYYALPLFTFMYRDLMKKYFSQNKSDIEQLAFRAILTSYIKNLYPVTTVLPIGDGYREFPFIVFRSFTFKEARNKMFADNYLLISNEMNVLNMILSYKK